MIEELIVTSAIWVLIGFAAGGTFVHENRIPPLRRFIRTAAALVGSAIVLFAAAAFFNLPMLELPI